MKKIRILLVVSLSVMLVISTCMISLHLFQARVSEAADRTAAHLVKPIPEAPVPESQPLPSVQTIALEVVDREVFLSDPTADSLLALDLASLTEVNPDVQGWISIPGTNISYPLVQGADNDYYLHNTWDHQPSYRGSVFMECRSSAALDDFNTIIYAHNLLDGTMFSQLHRYKNADFFRENPYVYIVNGSGAYRYRIFAAYEVPTNASAYRLRFNEEQKQAFLDDSLRLSVHDAGVTPTTEDQVLTLSTCTGVIRSNRWVIQAVLEGRVISPTEFKLQTPGSQTVLLFE